MGYWARERNCSVQDQCLASLSLFWERYNRSEESDLKFESFMHSSLSCPNVSMSASFSSSSTSDASQIDSALYLVDIGGEERKLNCGLLGRSSSRRTGCEGKLWPAERDCDQDLIRAFSTCVGYSEEGSCITRSDSQLCFDGGCEQSNCINAGKEGGKESEGEGVEDDTASEEHPQEEQVGEENRDRVTDTDNDKRLGEETEVEETKPGRQLRSDSGETFRDLSKSDFTTRMPAKSTERLPISSRGTQLESVEHTLRRLTETPLDAVSSELGPGLSVRFRAGAESVDPLSRVLARGKEPPLAERRSRSHEFFGERLDVVGSRRDDGSGAQIGLSSSWGDDLRGSQEQLSFPGEDTVECITNVGEQDDFGTFDVEEFQTSHHVQPKHDEPIQETERLSEFHSRGENSQDKQSSPSPTFDSPQTQNETTLRTRAGTRPRSTAKESGDISHLPVEGGRKIPERVEAGRARKGQEKDLRGEGHLRHSEAAVASDERRVRARLDGPAPIGRGEETEDVSTKVVRPSRPSGGKDRHSKVNTAKGPRDRRVRLSVPTAVQFYDVQDRLGYDQPSKAVEWLIKKAKAAIDELGRLPPRGGNDGPSTMSDITHASPYSSSLGGPVSGSSSCLPERSFSASLNGPFVDHMGNQMSYFIDSPNQQGVAFGNHSRDVVEGIGLSQGNLVSGQGQLAGLSFPLGQADLSRGSPGCVDGGKPGEFPGRAESRHKAARERARERAKEKGTGRDCGKVTGGGSSPSSMQSPPLHQNPIQSSFGIQNAMQPSVHGLSLQNPHPSPLQSSLSSVFVDATLSGIMQSSQQGTLQNLIMQNTSLQSPLTDQVPSSLQHPFQASLPTTLQLTSQSMTSILNAGMQQQGSHLQRSSLEGSSQRALHPGSGFTPGPCSSSFSEATSLSSSDFMSVSSIPISHSLSMSELSSYGISSPTSMEPHYPTGSSGVQIPPGFSPGPPVSSFRSRPSAINQTASKEPQPRLQGLTRPPCQLILPPYSTGHGLASPGGSTSSKASTSLYYPPTSSRMGGLQSLSSIPLESSSFSSIRNVGYDYQRVQMMSPGRGAGSYQSSSSQLQMPARLHGLDDFDDELKGSPPSSPHVHP